MSDSLRARLIALAITGALLLNYPLLSLFARDGLLLGIPVMYLYIFSVWAGFIFAVAAILRAARTGRHGDHPDG